MSNKLDLYKRNRPPGGTSVVSEYRVCYYGFYLKSGVCTKIVTPSAYIAYPGSGLIKCPNGQLSMDGIKCTHVHQYLS
eukprot:gnl/Chilomastix_caulleri/3558.p3 GENE.gnl/Chilomastix_caulleri/3558~~gnl/Chilomastix_caulleri/3558.p3  ORF type:complete len:78 (+),score=0.16 gnl/Chilomastix_caulleri/3558:429-662(+)